MSTEKVTIELNIGFNPNLQDIKWNETIEFWGKEENHEEEKEEENNDIVKFWK